MLNSAEIGRIRNAHALGQEATVKIGSRTLQYEPNLVASGMTMFGENGF
jgi:hypothetical protein